MPGKRLYDSSLTRTSFAQAMIDSQELAEMLVDWDGLNEGRPIPLKLIGNSRSQGSADNITYTDEILSTHAYVRLSADGGTNWIVFKMSACDGSETPVAHDAVTIGAPDGGLAISASQVLTLSPATTLSAGSLSAADKIKVDNFGGYTMTNVGTGESIYKDIITNTFNLKSLTHGTRISLTSSTDEILIDLDNVPDEIMSAVTSTLVYADTTALIADQLNQTEGQFYQVDPEAFYKYNGTTVGDITDYVPIVNPDIQKDTYTITLPSNTTVQSRIDGVGAVLPPGWTAAAGSNPVDIDITHGLNRRVSNVTVFSVSGTEERLLLGNAAWSGLLTPTIDTLRLESLATINLEIKIYITFV